MVDLGSHRLRDLHEIEHVFQLVVDGIPADFPPLRSLDAFDHNLPVQRTEFVGRASELDRVSSLLAERRLVTVSAVGGAGKTRLALEVGARLLGEPFDGVHFVDLGPIDDPTMVAPAVAEAVRMPEGFGLAAFLRPRRQLLILDNCEHLLDAAAELVDELLVACPDLTVLATSREALDVEGEQLVPLGPLDPHGEGVELFIARARLLDPTYAPDARRREVIEQICDHLDGLPLAIEMAAARARDMAESELLDRLDDRFAVLRGGRRRVDRQRTLEAAIDWSYDLLSEESKGVLRRMTVFAGPATVNDVAAVCAGADGGSVVESLQDLVNANLVVVRTEEYGTGHTLLETIQHYATRKLSDAGEVDATRDRFLAYYAERTVEFIVSMPPMGVLAWARANMRAAIEHGLSTGADELVITIYGTFGGLIGRLGGLDLHPAVERAARRAGGAFPAVVDYIHLEQVAYRPRLRRGCPPDAAVPRDSDPRPAVRMDALPGLVVGPGMVGVVHLRRGSTDGCTTRRRAGRHRSARLAPRPAQRCEDEHRNRQLATPRPQSRWRGPAREWLHTGRWWCSTPSTGQRRRSRHSTHSTPGATMSSHTPGLWRLSSTMRSATRPEPTPRWRSHCGRRARQRCRCHAGGR